MFYYGLLEHCNLLKNSLIRFTCEMFKKNLHLPFSNISGENDHIILVDESTSHISGDEQMIDKKTDKV